jgi:hypothetical protein
MGAGGREQDPGQVPPECSPWGVAKLDPRNQQQSPQADHLGGAESGRRMAGG